eukprot:scaffold1672_cov155-Ochromonas_danica.AAC.8
MRVVLIWLLSSLLALHAAWARKRALANGSPTQSPNWWWRPKPGYPSPSPTSSNIPTLFPTSGGQAITPLPTLSPTTLPTTPPTISPTASPSTAPSVSPSAVPSTTPSVAPSISPSYAPSTSPTQEPSLGPSGREGPSVSPTQYPSLSPTSSGTPL